jgi:hypothetical protein
MQGVKPRKSKHGKIPQGTAAIANFVLIKPKEDKPGEDKEEGNGNAPMLIKRIQNQIKRLRRPIETLRQMSVGRKKENLPVPQHHGKRGQTPDKIQAVQVGGKTRVQEKSVVIMSSSPFRRAHIELLLHRRTACRLKKHRDDAFPCPHALTPFSPARS